MIFELITLIWKLIAQSETRLKTLHTRLTWSSPIQSCACRLHLHPPLPYFHAGYVQGWNPQPVSDEEVYAAFQAFSNFGAGAMSPARNGMDGPRFAKLCRETGLQGGKLNSIAVDIVFSKIKAKVCIRVLLSAS